MNTTEPVHPSAAWPWSGAADDLTARAGVSPVGAAGTGDPAEIARGEACFAGEPRLIDVLAEPMVCLLMARDGWTRSGLEALLAAARPTVGALRI